MSSGEEDEAGWSEDDNEDQNDGGKITADVTDTEAYESVLEKLYGSSVLDDGSKTHRTPKLTTPDYKYLKLNIIGPPPKPTPSDSKRRGTNTTGSNSGKTSNKFSPSSTGASPTKLSMHDSSVVSSRPAETTISLDFSMMVTNIRSPSAAGGTGAADITGTATTSIGSPGNYIDSMLRYQSLAAKIFKKPGRRERVPGAANKPPPSSYRLKKKAEAEAAAAEAAAVAAAGTTGRHRKKIKRKGSTRFGRLGDSVLCTASLVDDDNDEFILRKLAEATFSTAGTGGGIKQQGGSDALQMKPQRPNMIRSSKVPSPRPNTTTTTSTSNGFGGAAATRRSGTADASTIRSSRSPSASSRPPPGAGGGGGLKSKTVSKSRPQSPPPDRPKFLSIEPPRSVLGVPYSTAGFSSSRTGNAGSPPRPGSSRNRGRSPTPRGGNGGGGGGGGSRSPRHPRNAAAADVNISAASYQYDDNSALDAMRGAPSNHRSKAAVGGDGVGGAGGTTRGRQRATLWAPRSVSPKRVYKSAIAAAEEEDVTTSTKRDYPTATTTGTGAANAATATATPIVIDYIKPFAFGRYKPTAPGYIPEDHGLRSRTTLRSVSPPPTRSASPSAADRQLHKSSSSSSVSSASSSSSSSSSSPSERPPLADDDVVRSELKPDDDNEEGGEEEEAAAAAQPRMTGGRDRRAGVTKGNDTDAYVQRRMLMDLLAKRLDSNAAADEDEDDDDDHDLDRVLGINRSGNDTNDRGRSPHTPKTPKTPKSSTKTAVNASLNTDPNNTNIGISPPLGGIQRKPSSPFAQAVPGTVLTGLSSSTPSSPRAAAVAPTSPSTSTGRTATRRPTSSVLRVDSGTSSSVKRSGAVTAPGTGTGTGTPGVGNISPRKALSMIINAKVDLSNPEEYLKKAIQGHWVPSLLSHHLATTATTANGTTAGSNISEYQHHDSGDWSSSRFAEKALQGDEFVFTDEVESLFKAICEFDKDKFDENFHSALTMLYHLHDDLRCPTGAHKTFWDAHCTESPANLLSIVSRISMLSKARRLLAALLRAAAGVATDRDFSLAFATNARARFSVIHNNNRSGQGAAVGTESSQLLDGHKNKLSSSLVETPVLHALHSATPDLPKMSKREINTSFGRPHLTLSYSSAAGVSGGGNRGLPAGSGTGSGSNVLNTSAAGGVGGAFSSNDKSNSTAAVVEEYKLTLTGPVQPSRIGFHNQTPEGIREAARRTINFARGLPETANARPLRPQQLSGDVLKEYAEMDEEEEVLLLRSRDVKSSAPVEGGLNSSNNHHKHEKYDDDGGDNDDHNGEGAATDARELAAKTPDNWRARRLLTSIDPEAGDALFRLDEQVKKEKEEREDKEEEEVEQKEAEKKNTETGADSCSPTAAAAVGDNDSQPPQEREEGSVVVETGTLVSNKDDGGGIGGDGAAMAVNTAGANGSSPTITTATSNKPPPHSQLSTIQKDIEDHNITTATPTTATVTTSTPTPAATATATKDTSGTAKYLQSLQTRLSATVTFEPAAVLEQAGNGEDGGGVDSSKRRNIGGPRGGAAGAGGGQQQQRNRPISAPVARRLNYSSHAPSSDFTLGVGGGTDTAPSPRVSAFGSSVRPTLSLLLARQQQQQQQHPEEEELHSLAYADNDGLEPVVQELAKQFLSSLPWKMKKLLFQGRNLLPDHHIASLLVKAMPDRPSSSIGIRRGSPRDFQRKEINLFNTTAEKGSKLK